MGSTVTTGRMAAALRASTGAIVYCLYEQTYEKNCFQHAPHWSAVYIGDAAGAVRKVFGYASMCEGGMLQNRSGHITPEGYLRTWLAELAAPARMDLRHTVELYAKADVDRAPLQQTAIPAVAATLANAGLRSEADDLLTGQPISLSLVQQGELIGRLVQQHNISPWALLRDYTRPQPDTERCPSLGIRPSSAYHTKPDLPPALIVSSRGDMILRGRDGTWRCRGWPYEIVGRLVESLGHTEQGFPANYCSLISSFREHLKAAPEADPAQLLLRIDRRLATDSWQRESVEKAAALPGASIDDNIVTVPFSIEHDYLLTHQPRDATTWFVLNEAELFPDIAWSRRATW